MWQKKEKKETDVNTGDAIRPMEDIKHTTMITDPDNTIQTDTIKMGVVK